MEAWQERTALLIGRQGLQKLHDSTVWVVGLGGVGAFAAEMLCRAGVGHLLLVDPDTVGDTNRNRQLPALVSTTGRLKTEVMKERLLDINPQVEITTFTSFLTEDSMGEVFEGLVPDYVVDAIDTLGPKVALICYCHAQKYPLVSAMGAGAKMDATAVRVADLSKTYNCPLAAFLRKRLRRRGITKGIKAVFSQELPDGNAVVPCVEQNKNSQVGTISYLPAVFGCVCAQAVIQDILKLVIFEDSD